MRKSLLWRLFPTVLVLFVSTSLHAQLFGDLNRPPKSGTMPEWAKFLYVEPINIFRVDSAILAYQRVHGVEKNNYSRYYKRWRHAVANYILPDGSLTKLSPDALEGRYRSSKLKSQNAALGNVWTPLTMNTYFPGDTTCAWQANVYSLAVSESDPTIMVCGTEPGGIYKTTDSGLNWTEIGKDYLLQTHSIAIHPTDPNTIYIATNGAIRKSIDGGATWVTVFSQPNFWGYRLKILRDNPNIIVAGANSGIYRSTDAGSSWNKVLNSTTCELAVNPSNSSMVYALVLDSAQLHYQFWKSYDAGASFIVRLGGWYPDTSTGAGRMTVSAADPKRVYAILLTTKGPKILRSNDEGESWSITATGSSDSLVMNNGQGYYDLGIIASALDADQVIVGTQTIYKSIDGAKHFIALGGYAGPFPTHPDFQDVQVHGSDTWIATDGGITHSTDFFTDLKNAGARMRGVNGSDFWGFDAGWNQDIMVGGRYHNGNTAISEKYHGKFLRMGGGEAATGYVNPMRSNFAYFSDIGAYVLPDSFSNSFSNIPIAKWPNESYFEMWYSRMTWDPRCYNTIWIGAQNKLWRSENGGASYDSMFALKDSTAWIEHIEIARSNPSVMYITAHSNTSWDARIWRSTNGGASWDTLPLFPATTGNDRRVMTIALSGTDENEIWAALNSGSASNKVFHSTDGGMHWINLTTPTIANCTITDLMHQLGTDGGVYIAAAGGQVFYRNHNLNDWQPYNSGLPVSESTRALKPLYRDNKLRIGSNLGIWETSLYEPSKPVAQPMVDKMISACPRDTFYFDDYSSLQYDHESWNWSFPGASFVSSTSIRNPKVVYAKSGSYSVTLQVQNGEGSSTKTIPNMITMSQSECGIDSFAVAALDLTPANSSATIPEIPAMKGDTAFTVSAWIKLAHVQSSFSQLVSNWSSNVGFSLGFAFEGYTPNTNLTFYWAGVPYQLTTPFNLDTNVWIHVAMTVEPSKVTLYKNGIPWVYSGTFRNFDLASTPFTIGGGLPGQGGRFDGEIDELKFYNRALSQSEIREKMHLISPIAEDGLAAYYQFNENPSTTLYDRVGDAAAANGGGQRAISTAPVATGSSTRVRVTTAGSQNFTNAGVQIYYDTQDSLPNDDVVAYRLFAEPDSLPRASGINTFSTNYWIIRNWGDASGGIDTLVLSNIGTISSQDSANESQEFKLFTRNPNEFLNDWNTSTSTPIEQFASRKNTLTFQMPDSAIYRQFFIGDKGNSTLAIPLQNANRYSHALTIHPNPASGNVSITFQTNETERELRVTLWDMIGREQQIRNIPSAPNSATSVTLNLAGLPNGCYILRVNKRSGLLIKQ